MSYRNVLLLSGTLLATHSLLHGPLLLAAWLLVGVGSAFGWRGPRFFRTVLLSELAIGLGYYLLLSPSPQVQWLQHNSALPAYAWLALVIGFNVVSGCICVGVPYAVARRVRRLLAPKAPAQPAQAPAYALAN